MILAIAATEFEMRPFLRDIPRDFCLHLISGVGPVESCFRLSDYIHRSESEIQCVVNFGIAGIFPDSEKGDILDICIAESEILGDFGVCFPQRIEPLSPEIANNKRIAMDPHLIEIAEKTCLSNEISHCKGHFVTVNCVSGTRRRGEILHDCNEGLCENMEGAAIARVCEAFSIPVLEVRCASNYVEDRDISRWEISEAVGRAADAAALITREIHYHEQP